MIDIVSHHRILAIFSPGGKTSLLPITVDCPRSDAKNYAEPITAKLLESWDIPRPLGIVLRSAYSKHYRINEEELIWVGERVEQFGRVVHQVCSERIAILEIAARE